MSGSCGWPTGTRPTCACTRAAWVITALRVWQTCNRPLIWLRRCGSPCRRGCCLHTPGREQCVELVRRDSILQRSLPRSCQCVKYRHLPCGHRARLSTQATCRPAVRTRFHLTTAHQHWLWVLQAALLSLSLAVPASTQADQTATEASTVSLNGPRMISTWLCASWWTRTCGGLQRCRLPLWSGCAQRREQHQVSLTKCLLIARRDEQVCASAR